VLLELLAAAKPVVVRVQEGSGGASAESIFVFIGGVIAAVAAVAAAIITTRGASSRLHQQLVSERERFDKQLAAEVTRFESQFAHERYLVRRDEASSSVEQITRVIARNEVQAGELVNTLLLGGEVKSEVLDETDRQLNELREEIGLLAIRFGRESPIAKKMVDILKALQALLGCAANMPLDDEQKKELAARRKEMNDAGAAFLVAAKETLDSYS
jgi:hypothetical protein